jgi:cobalt/nickel transport system permease protein
MHMADTLVSPAVGGAMWAASLALAGYSARKVTRELPERKVPLMGVLGAFVFAAQMINFAIPGTGSSGHLGGGMILAILLGPHAAFLVMFSILAVQALLFADGGLLALGCNVFNLGFWPCFAMYPLLFRPLAGRNPTQVRLLTASVVSGVLALQLGAFGVVFQTLFSGISELPFGPFVLMMQPIHLAIGVVEGVVTAALVAFVWKARPEVLEFSRGATPPAGRSLRPVLVSLVLAAVITGGALSWFASTHPDGLEWSMGKTAGQEELEAPTDGVHRSLAAVQEKTALLPDYGFAEAEDAEAADPGTTAAEEPWPAVNAGTTVSGLVGAGAVLLAAVIVGAALRQRHPKAA